MIGLLLFIGLTAFVVCGFCFSRTSKEMPKTWYEWKTEFRYQYLGMVGLFQDFQYRSRDRVELYKQPGKIAVITGGNRGIGLQVVKKLLDCDMTVVMGVRDPSSAEKIVSSIVDLKSSGGKLICEKLDIGDLKSVKEFASKVKERFDKVHILLNNAGIMFAPFRLTNDGYESHFATNYLGHFLLTHLLMPQLKAAGKEGKNARVVNVSSCVNVIGRINYNDINGLKNYYPASAYSQSKLAQILFTRHLQNRLDAENAHVQVTAVHPGIVDTDLFEHSSTTSVPFIKKLFFKTPEQGSNTVVYAAIAPKIEGKGGLYLSNCSKGQIHRDGTKVEKCKKFFEFSCELLKLNEYGNGKI